MVSGLRTLRRLCGNMIVKSKICTKCNKLRPLSRFNNRKASKDKLELWCKTCTQKACKAYRKEKPQVLAAAKSKWKKANSTKEKQNNRNYHLTKYWPNLTPIQA